MKQLLKELRRPAYKSQQAKLHPSLKQGLEDENTQILHALLEAEEKDYKPPTDLVIEAPQTKLESPTANFPLMNFLKNKRVGDISPVAQVPETPLIDNKYADDLLLKLKSTKEELNDVLSELDKSGTRRRDMSGSPDDNMDDLSPETQELMRKVMNKGGESLASLGTKPKEKPEYPTEYP